MGGTVTYAPTTVDGLRFRKIMGHRDWNPPLRREPDGWMLRHRNGTSSAIVTVAPHDGIEWIHASLAHSNHMPTYADLVRLHHAAFGHKWAYQVFAPTSDHVNIHPYALHLWGRVDGVPALPNFGAWGSI